MKKLLFNYDRRGALASVALKLWSILAGPLQTAFILAWVAPQSQGLWYALSSLQRFQALLELGMGVTLASAIARCPGVQAGAWLRFGNLWHLGMAIGWLFLAGPLGAYWLWQQTGVAALLPWFALVLASAVGMPPLPTLIALEARQQVAAVSLFRTVQGMFSRLLSWGCLGLGLGIWAQITERVVASVLAWGWLWQQQRPQQSPSPLRQELHALQEAIQQAPALNYRTDIFPLQWRIAAATAGGSLPFAVLIPMSIQATNALEGGRLGATLGLLGGLQGMAWALLTPVFPAIGRLLAEKQYAKAAQQLQQTALIATMLFILGIFCLMALLSWPYLAQRLCEPIATLLLSTAFVLRFIREIYAGWCRADLRPVTWPVDLLEGLWVVALLSFWGKTLLWICGIFAISSLLNLLLSLILGGRGR